MTRFALMMWLPRKRLTPWTVLKVAGYQAAFASLKLRQQMMEKLNSLLTVGYAEFRATLIVQGVGALRLDFVLFVVFFFAQHPKNGSRKRDIFKEYSRVTSRIQFFLLPCAPREAGALSNCIHGT